VYQTKKENGLKESEIRAQKKIWWTYDKREREKEETGENYVMKSFMVCIPHQTTHMNKPRIVRDVVHVESLGKEK
jgi:hypothetical protein